MNSDTDQPRNLARICNPTDWISSFAYIARKHTLKRRTKKLHETSQSWISRDPSASASATVVTPTLGAPAVVAVAAALIVTVVAVVTAHRLQTRSAKWTVSPVVS